MLLLMLFSAMILTAVINSVLALQYTGAPGQRGQLALILIRAPAGTTGCPSTKKVSTVKIMVDLHQKRMK